MADPLAPPPPKPQAPMKPVEDLTQMRQKFFAGRRDEANRNAIGQQQQMGDAINRKFTSMGQGGSGAAIGAHIKGQEAVQAQNNAALNELSGQEASLDATMNFNQQMSDRDHGLKREIFDVEKANKSRELDLADKQFGLDESTTGFNRRLAESEMNRKAPGLLDSLGLGGISETPIIGDIMKANPITSVLGGGDGK